MERATAVKRLTLLLSMLYFTSYITRINFSAAMAEIISKGVLTKTEAGLIGTVMFIVYGFFQVISGKVSDKFSEEKIITAGLIVTIICNILMPLVSTPILMTVVWGFNGMAQSFFWPPIVKTMSSLTNTLEYSKNIFWVITSAQIATVVIFLIVPLNIQLFSWRGVFFFSAAFGLVYLIIWKLFYKKTADVLKADLPQKSTSEVTSHKSEKEFSGKVIASSGIVIIFVAIVMTGFLKDGIQSWFPTLLTEVFHLNASNAILLNIIIPIFSIASFVLFTYIYSNVIQNEIIVAIILFSFSTAATILMSLLFGKSSIAVIVIAALTNAAMHGINLMITSYVPKRFAKYGTVGTMSGLTNAFIYVGSAVSSYGIGFIADNYSWNVTAISWAAIAFIGLVASLIALPKWTKFIKN